MKNSSFFNDRSIWLPICLILLACGLWPEMELLVPSLPSLKRVFAVDDGQIQQLLTANFCGFLLGVLLAGPLCDSIGRRVVLIYGSVSYLIISMFCALTDQFSFLMIARFLQGFAMTGPVIAGGVILFEMTSGSRQVFWMSLTNSAVTFCMAMAPIIGTWVNAQLGFKGNLWAIFILGCLGIIPASIFAPESLKVENRHPLVLRTLLEGYITLIKDWRFMCLALPVCALAAAYWVYVGVSALYMVDYLGIEPTSFASYQGPIVGCFSIISLASSWLLKKFGLSRCLKFGIALMFTGCLLLFAMSVNKADAAQATTIFMMLFVGGMAPVCSMLFPYSMNHLPAKLQGNAQAMIQALRLLFASLGTFILGFVYDGPLLPVATIMLIILLASTVLLWMARGFIEEDQQIAVGVVGH